MRTGDCWTCYSGQDGQQILVILVTAQVPGPDRDQLQVVSDEVLGQVCAQEDQTEVPGASGRGDARRTAGHRTQSRGHVL